jgi:hypothetical protein
VIADNSASNDGDVIGNKGNKDSWIVKIDSVGIIQWQQSIGGSSSDGATAIKFTDDGGFAVAGFTGSNDSDVIGNHGIGDAWFIKLDQVGNLLWQKCYGGGSDDFAMSLDLVPNNGYVIAAVTTSNDGDVSGYHDAYVGYHDYWIVRIDSVGTLLWQKCLGGNADDISYSVITSDDDNYIVAGYSYSNDGDVSANHGGDDAWVIKLSGETGIFNLQREQFSFLFPNPSTISVKILSSNEPSSFLIRDVDGRILLRQTIVSSQQSIDISKLPDGIYIAELCSKQQRVIEKFIKQ